MRDLNQAEDLGIDTTDMVVVTHPDKKTRFGRGPAEFQMTRLAFVKRGLAERGYHIKGDASTAARPTSREQALMAEVEALRRRLAEGATSREDPQPGEADKDALQAQAEALGVQFHRNWGVKKLQSAIDDARAALEADDFGEEDDTE